jgi:hypothetical protein
MIFVFRTNVSFNDLETLQPLLDKYLTNSKWNFDLEDCENILRIDSKSEISELTIKLLEVNGFDCIELAD